MFLLTEEFKAGTKIFQIPLKWYRKVTAFLNHVTGSNGISVKCPAEPSGSDPVEIGLDKEWFDNFLGSGFVKVVKTQATTPAEGTTEDQSSTRYNGATVYGTTEHTNGLEFKTDTWAANNTGTALKLTVFTRIFWNKNYTSDGSNYCFALWREITINPNGTIKSVSDEKGLIQIRHA